MNISKNRRIAYQPGLLLALFFCQLACPGNQADAALVVNVAGLLIDAGGTGFVDITIHSSGSDSLDLANYVFSITNVGNPSSTLQFSAVQDLTENQELNYVFADDLDPLGLTIHNQSSSSIEMGDGTLNLNGVSIDSTPRLLARLELQHVLGPTQTAAQAAGEQFHITLQAVAGTFFEDENGDEFSYDQLNNPSPLTLAAESFNPGLITVNATAVPEPSSLLLLAFGGVGLIARSRRKHYLLSAAPIAR